jgi:hypothetical protein
MLCDTNGYVLAYAVGALAVGVQAAVAARVVAGEQAVVGVQAAVALQLAHWVPSDLPRPSHVAIGPHN